MKSILQTSPGRKPPGRGSEAPSPRFHAPAGDRWVPPKQSAPPYSLGDFLGDYFLTRASLAGEDPFPRAGHKGQANFCPII